jgi:ABC-type glutathione transport system ATPase component
VENPWRISGAEEMRGPAGVRDRYLQLVGQRNAITRTKAEKAAQLAGICAYLARADAVESALDQLSQKLFGELVTIIEQKLSQALQEVLEQPIALKVERDFKRGVVTMGLHIERGGEREDILRGQGGSVANVLSVGLRLLALMTLEQKEHRRFLVLDEQDCWLKPDLVPKLVGIVHAAAKELGFQVVMISHHDISAFERYADKIYRFTPMPEGVKVMEMFAGPVERDA